MTPGGYNIFYLFIFFAVSS